MIIKPRNRLKIIRQFDDAYDDWGWGIVLVRYDDYPLMGKYVGSAATLGIYETWEQAMDAIPGFYRYLRDRGRL